MVEIQNLGSGASINPFETPPSPLQPWRFRRCPYTRGQYNVLIRHDGSAKGLQASIEIGTTAVLQRSDVSNGLTEGIMPTPAGANATPVHQFTASAGDEVVLTLFETGAVATTDIMVWANVEPLIP